ncbi:MAG TPA: GNAT family N-acetyltransferase [bacterium]|nr:GNAT family N-acetyltransferase [bacterium]
MREMTTNRLRIRAFALEDLDAYAGLLDAAFGRSEARGAYRDRLAYYELGERVLAELHQPPYGDRAMVLRETGQLVGAVGFVPSLGPFGQLPFFGRTADARFTPEVGLFWAVLPEHRGRGLASEAAAAMARFAFDELHLRRVVATAEYDNAASTGVMRRIGMTVQHNPWSTPDWFQAVGILEP